MRKSWIIILIVGIQSLWAQKTWDQYLLMSNDSLFENPIYGETILDGVIPTEQDTTFWPETQRLRIVFGDVLEGLLGLRWESFHQKRTKLVGQSCREVEPYDGPLTKEYDINFYIVPHLPHYIDTVANWWDRAGRMGRNIFHSVKSNPQVEVPDKLKMGKSWYLYVGCENTPIKSKRKLIDSLFFPCLQNHKGLKGHPNFGYVYAPIGFYGPAVMDCNHSCKPEIHPYEWLWWLKPDSSNATKKEWFVGFHRDWSKRFRNWSTSPRIGKIAIPLMLKADADIQINFDMLVYDEFKTANHVDYFDDMVYMPAQSFNTEVLRYTVNMNITGLPENSVMYKFIGMEEVNVDGTKYLKGWLQLGMAIKNIAEFKVTYDPMN